MPVRTKPDAGLVHSTAIHRKDPANIHGGRVCGCGVMDVEIPWLKRFEEEPQEDPDELELIDYETMLEELEFR